MTGRHSRTPDEHLLDDATGDRRSPSANPDVAGIGLWLNRSGATHICDEASLTLIREEIRRRGAHTGLTTEAVERMAAAASELGHNQLRHAGGGLMAVRAAARGAVAGLEVVATDAGPGIANPAAALAGPVHPSTAPGTSLGVGLSAARRLTDEMDLDVRTGEGTAIAVRSFAAPVPASEVAVLGRMAPGELVSGDDAVILRDSAGTLTVAVIDGVGHGPLARDAARDAVQVIRRRSDAPLVNILRACDEELRTTRGAVATLARLDPTTSRLTLAGVGNVSAALYQPGDTRRFTGMANVLGGRLRGRRPRVEHLDLSPHGTLILFSDGLVSRADLAHEPETLRTPPMAVAQRMLERFSRDDDDALVMVIR